MTNQQKIAVAHYVFKVLLTRQYNTPEDNETRHALFLSLDTEQVRLADQMLGVSNKA